MGSLFIFWGGRLWIIPLYDYRLDAVRIILLGKKCVCEIEDKGGKYGNILYFDSCNRKWLKVYHIVFILFYLEDVIVGDDSTHYNCIMFCYLLYNSFLFLLQKNRIYVLFWSIDYLLPHDNIYH